MADEIMRLRAADFGELMPFLTRAFGYAEPDWFATHLPTLYRPTDERMACNLAVRRNGRLAAVVGVFPFAWRVGGSELRVAGIGGVGTDPDLRKSGLMRLLMDRALAEIRAAGFHLSYLGGQRQRYRYWGWERAGAEIRAVVNPANLRHEMGGDALGVSLSLPSNDPEEIATLRALHDAQPSHCNRAPGFFMDHLRLWGSNVQVARVAGRVVGYAVIDRKWNHVSELVACDLPVAREIIRAVVGEGPEITFSFPSGDLARSVALFAEKVSVEESGNWQVFDWPTTLTALLRARRQDGELSTGEIVLGIRGEPRRLALRVGANEAVCEPTDAPAALELDAPAMLQFLCGPLLPSQRTRLPPAAACLDAWCPLPLRLSRQDHV